MRSLLALLMLLLMMGGSTFGADREAVQAKNDTAVPTVPNSVAQEDSQNAAQPAPSSREFGKKNLQYSPTDNTCYTMHSMLVAKQPGSDVTETVGQRTCTPASRFQMKHSVQQAR
jgi:hypothetical protein